MRDLTERRSETRRTVFLRAKVYGADGAQITECAIMNASRFGCKIISEALDGIPEVIVLSICGLGESFTGRLVWRDANMAGVEFIQHEAATAQTKPTNATPISGPAATFS